MKTYKNPKDWLKLTERPKVKQANLNELVNQVFKDVQKNGDKALKKYSMAFDQVKLKTLRIGETEIQKAAKQISPELKKAIQVAKTNIEKFHASQKELNK